DLRSFSTSLEVTERLAGLLPGGTERPVLVSGRGIFSPADVARGGDSGADAVPVGEALITAPDIGPRGRGVAGVDKNIPQLSGRLRPTIDSSYKEQPMVGPRCSAENDNTMQFCYNCGTRLQTAAPTPNAPAHPPPVYGPPAQPPVYGPPAQPP